MKIVTKQAYDRLLAGARVLEQDTHGVKVLRLADGLFFKQFRMKHLFTSKWFYPESLRFLWHAAGLRRRGIATVTVLQRVWMPHLWRSGVIYKPLAGRTLRQVAGAGELDGALAERLGGFVAGLHRKGVYFRSLHLGNVVLCPDGELGLIDIADMTLFPWPLPLWRRGRNFRHLFRYAEDAAILTGAGLELFKQGYCQAQPQARAGWLDELTACLIQSVSGDSDSEPGAVRRAGWPGPNLWRYASELFRGGDRYVRRTMANGWLICDRDCDDKAMAEFLADCDRRLAQGVPLKMGNSTTVGLVEVGGRKLAVKNYHAKNIFKALRKQLPWPPGRIQVSWINAHLLTRMGIATPRPVAICQKKAGWWKTDSYFIAGYQPGADFWHQIYDHMNWRDHWDAVLDKMIALQKQLGAARIVHGDFKATNLIDTGDRFALIDLDAMRQVRSERALRRGFTADCLRFLLNWRQVPDFEAMARLRQFEVLAEYGDFRAEGVLERRCWEGGLTLWQLPAPFCHEGGNPVDLKDDRWRALLAAWRDPERAGGELLQRSPRHSSYRVRLDGRTFVVRVFPLNRIKDRLYYRCFAGSEVVDAMKARRAGIPTPGYYGYFEIRRFGLVSGRGVIVEDGGKAAAGIAM